MVSVATPLARPARRLEPKWLVLGAVVAIVAWLALVPLFFLVWQSFMTPASFDMPAVFTLANYQDVFGSVRTWRLFANSAGYALGSALLALAVGTTLAWICERTNTPGKALFYAMSVVPIVIPGILFVTAWIMLASPQI